MRHVGQSEIGNKGWSTNPCCGTLCITKINFYLCIHLGKNGETLKSTECCFHTCCYEKGVKMILCRCHGFYFSKQSKKSKQEATVYTLMDNRYSARDVLSWCTTDNTEISIFWIIKLQINQF